MLGAVPVSSMWSFRPVERLPRHAIKSTFEKLVETIRNAARRSGYAGHIFIFIENCRSGWHFHAILSDPCPASLVKTVSHSWMRRMGQTDNSRKVFHTTGTADNPADLRAYATKIQKAGFFTKTAAPEYQSELNIKPFRHLRFVPSVCSTSHGLNRWTQAPDSANPKRGEPSTSKLSLPMSPPENEIENDRAEALPGGHFSCPISPRPESQPSCKITVRVVPRYRPSGEIIPPPTSWIVGHFENLSRRWMVIGFCNSPPPFGFIDGVFCIPAGRAAEFEREAAPLSGWTRIVRQ